MCFHLLPFGVPLLGLGFDIGSGEDGCIADTCGRDHGASSWVVACEERPVRRRWRRPNRRGLGAAVEQGKLEGDYGLQIHNNMYDLRKEALGKCPAQRLSTCPGLKELASVVAGIYLEKPRCICSGDWDLECLSYKQVEYACLDAYACCRIGVTLFFGYQWACSPSTCAYIECQEHVVSPETSDYEQEYEERSDSPESSI